MVKNATSLVTIEHFRAMFATHGLPEMLVTDNGTPFVSEEIEQFYKQNGICHVRSAPYHPATNGLAERAVQTVKDFRKKETKGSLQTRVSQFLMQHRITPHTVTGVATSELLMGRRIVSAHRRILGMASVVCVLFKICVSSISLYKLDSDKLTAPFGSAHQFTLSMHSFRLQNCSRLSLQFMLKSQSERFSHSLDTLCPRCTLICAYCDRGQGRCFFLFFERFESAAVTIRTLPRRWTLPP